MFVSEGQEDRGMRHQESLSSGDRCPQPWLDQANDQVQQAHKEEEEADGKSQEAEAEEWRCNCVGYRDANGDQRCSSHGPREEL